VVAGDIVRTVLRPSKMSRRELNDCNTASANRWP
jgi:hypothetical protein